MRKNTIITKMPTIQLVYIAIFFSCIWNIANAAILPQQNPVPGGIVIIPLEESSITAPTARFNANQVMVVANQQKPNHWLAVTGIPLKTKSGSHRLNVRWSDHSSEVRFAIKDFNYKTQHITLKGKQKKKVDLSKKALARVIKEKKFITSALKSWREEDGLEEAFILPVKGRLSSPFGLKRFFNKKPRKPHSGIDIAAPHGTPIVAPASGKIVRTGNYFFNGKSVFIDHGKGLVTMYCHMSKIAVKEGQSVKQGQSIGAIGKTGRATGPHLHWGVSLNNARVDPSLFYQDINKLLTP